MGVTYNELVEEFGFDMWPQSDRIAGKIGSAKPAWYFHGQLEEQMRDLENQKAQLAGGGVSPENLHRIRAQIARDEAKLDIIKDTFPTPTSHKKDTLDGIWQEIGAAITRSMYSYSDMTTGVADPHEEVRRAKDPIIPVSRPVARWIIYCNGNVVKDSADNELKIKRDDAVRAWQIAGRILGENTRSENLRPMERPRGARDGDYTRIFQGFDAVEQEAMAMPETQVKFAETELLDGSDLLDKKPEENLPDKEPAVRICEDCPTDISHTHHFTKRCDPCKEAREVANGRKDADPNAGGGTERKS